MLFRQLKLMPILLTILLVFLQYKLWFDAGGILKVKQLKTQLNEKKAENNQLKQRNEDLLLQIRTLQSNDDAIESRARQELGMIKKGEVFYQVVK